MTNRRIEIIGLRGIPEIARGADLAALILEACRGEELTIIDGDVFIVTQKIVSKAEGCTVRLADVEPSRLARSLAKASNKDPRVVEVALGEARRVVRMDRGILITETRHGFVCANSGVDASNVAIPDAVSTLPDAPDKSAERLRRAIEQASGKKVAVLISDTFGRPWREGVVDVAIGVAGMGPLIDYRGRTDQQGRSLATTVVAVADELTAAAELVMGKMDAVPVALVRGYPLPAGDGGAAALVRRAERDLFR